jgi:hypothetical protein
MYQWVMIVALASGGILATARSASRVVTLENRVSTLEATIDACCSTQYGPSPDEEASFRDYVELKKRIVALEEQISK